MTQNNMFYLYAVVIFICCSLTNCLEEGDPCTLHNTGRQSTCKTILNCPAALQQIQKQQFPQTCGFAGTSPIVCCDENANTPPKITTTTKKPTTTTTRTTTTRSTPRRTTKPTTSPTINPYRPNTTGYKSFQKCVEYSNQLITREKPPILFIDKEEVEKDLCGFIVVPLIVGGVPADRREFPHMVLVGYDSPDGVQWTCGGTLISERFVMTAGHCLISREFGNATHARIGVVNINDPANRQDIDVSELIRHPRYEPPSYYDDIGLLKLSRAVRINEYARPACLYYNSGTLASKAIATGWGRTDFTGYTSADLLKVTLDLVDAPTCNTSFRRISTQRLENGIVDATQMCAGSEGKDTCQGDSGGPLQIYSKIRCMYEIVGITSFGKACGIGKSPGVYTRVSYYMDWLEKIVFE